MSAHRYTACWKPRNGGNVGFTRIMKNAWTPLIWELVIWAFKQWNRQIDKQKAYTRAHAHAQAQAQAQAQVPLNRWQKKEGFDAFNLTLCFFYRLHLFISFVFIHTHSFCFSFIFFVGIIFHCVLLSSITYLWIFHLEFAIRSLFFTLAHFIFCLIFTETWNRFIGSCLAIKVPINDKERKNLNKNETDNVISVEQLALKIHVIDYWREKTQPQNQNKTKCCFVFSCDPSCK